MTLFKIILANPMTIYNLYIFDRHCQCIYHHAWSHSKQHVDPKSSVSVTAATSQHQRTVSSSGSSRVGTDTLESQVESSGIGGSMSIEEQAKLVYGVVFSLRNLVKKLSPDQGNDGFISYRTSKYRLHYYETPSGLKFVMMTDPSTLSMRGVLRQFYQGPYVEFVTKNPLQRVQSGESLNIGCELFRVAVDRFVRGLPFFE
ncbi:uncharacterized protein VTP21DRAFT_8257 [Calcarisporiella thermophila]|uniref:uncharacterized protein n=1 Tax=Calcarisporiella thermophila TaxID=911321 RepID=UPI003742700F